MLNIGSRGENDRKGKDKRCKMKFSLVIKPSIHPKTRHRIEDVLKEDGYAVIGGGQSTSAVSRAERFSDISFEKVKNASARTTKRK